MKNFKYNKLYRKVNTKAQNVCHGGNSDKYRRNAKDHDNRMKKPKKGLDYTPLFKFLLSKVGKDFDEVYSEAVKRLDKEEPIFYMVIKHNELIKTPVNLTTNEWSTDLRMREYFRYGEHTHFSNLYIDEDNLLQKVNPDLQPNDIEPICLCTHTLDGKKLTRKPDWYDK